LAAGLCPDPLGSLQRSQDPTLHEGRGRDGNETDRERKGITGSRGKEIKIKEGKVLKMGYVSPIVKVI